MGPFEQAIKTSILPKDLNNLSSKEKECLLCNRRVIDLLFESMDKDFADSIQEENKFAKICLDAYRLWQLLEAICKDLVRVEVRAGAVELKMVGGVA